MRPNICVFINFHVTWHLSVNPVVILDASTSKIFINFYLKSFHFFSVFGKLKFIYEKAVTISS